MTRRKISYLAVALTTALVSHAAYADKEQPRSEDQAKAQPEEREIEIAKVSGEATVKKIDKKNRKLTIMDDQGKPHTVKVPEQVKRFDAIQVGDKIKIDYYESVGLALEPKGEGKPGAPSETTMMGKKAGKLPGGMAVRTMTASAQVLDVDHQANTLTLKGPEGHIDTIHVTDPEEQADLQKVKKGDTIRARYTEALAINVERAPKAG